MVQWAWSIIRVQNRKVDELDRNVSQIRFESKERLLNSFSKEVERNEKQRFNHLSLNSSVCGWFFFTRFSSLKISLKRRIVHWYLSLEIWGYLGLTWKGMISLDFENRHYYYANFKSYHNLVTSLLYCFRNWYWFELNGTFAREKLSFQIWLHK